MAEDIECRLGVIKGADRVGISCLYAHLNEGVTEDEALATCTAKLEMERQRLREEFGCPDDQE